MNRQHVVEVPAKVFCAVPEEQCLRIGGVLEQHESKLLRIRIVRDFAKRKIEPITIWVGGKYQEHALPDKRAVYIEVLTASGMVETSIRPSRIAKIETEEATWRTILE